MYADDAGMVNVYHLELVASVSLCVLVVGVHAASTVIVHAERSWKPLRRYLWMMGSGVRIWLRS